VPAVGILGYPACWRWLRGRGDTPWYDSVRLLPQETPGDWSGVIAEVTEIIRERTS
jgi:hypothetical protein